MMQTLPYGLPTLQHLLRELGAIAILSRVPTSPTSCLYHCHTATEQYGIKADVSANGLRWEMASLQRFRENGIVTPGIVGNVTSQTGIVYFLYKWIPEEICEPLTVDKWPTMRSTIETIGHSASTASLENIREHVAFDISRSRRPQDDIKVLWRLFRDTFRSNKSRDTVLHGDLHEGNVLATKSGDIVILDPKIQRGPPGLDLLSYCFYAVGTDVAEQMLDDIDVMPWRERMLGVVRELARSPEVEIEPWVEWALKGGRPPGF